MEYVDLGLSVKWATCNVGASSPEEFGCYFAWGEIIPKNIYLQETYLPNKNFNKVFKLPTKTQWKELIDECTWTWTDDYNGTHVAGYIVVGSNNNSIFLPAMNENHELFIFGNRYHSSYWSSAPQNLNCAWDITLTPSVKFMYASYRYFGQLLRLVKKKNRI